jgi:hypothetical protein
MYKVFFRIVYGIVVALGLILTYNYTDSNIKTAYINEVGAEALEAGAYETFVPNQFYNDQFLYDQTYILEDMTLKVMVYEVVQVYFEKGELVINEGIFFLIHQLEGTPLDSFYSVKFKTAKNTTVEFLGIRIASLPLYTAIIPDTGSSFIGRDYFIKDDQYEVVTNLQVGLELVEEPIIDASLNITNERYQLKQILSNYYENNSQLPETEIGVLSLAPAHIIDTTKWALINMAIYMLVATIVTVFVFTFKKSKLGKKKPTPGLARDLERIEKDE